MIRKTRSYLDYKGKKVLDIATSDGLWAFEAEKLGAAQVVAIEKGLYAFERFLFCKQVLNSNVIPLFNTDVHKLTERLPPNFSKFDIIQHLGLFYHLANPLNSLMQARQMLADDGYLLFETAAMTNIKFSCMIFGGVKPEAEDLDYFWWRGYGNKNPHWYLTLPCIKELLLASSFEPIIESLNIEEQSKTYAINEDDPEMVYQRARISIVARALPVKRCIDKDIYEKILKPAIK